MAGRTQEAASSQRPKTGAPGINLPTPNVDDLILVDDITIRDGEGFDPLLPGTPHPTQSTARLVKETLQPSSGTERKVRRIYATDPAAQDAYNLAMQFAAESATHGVYIRRYTLLRPWTPATRAAALTSVVRLALTGGGSGYTTAPTVTISGGGGSGAAGKVQRKKGVIVAIMLTAGGTGYTSAPTVSITGGGGTGAAATASIQPAAAVLVHEEGTPASGELGSLYDSVTRVYRTLPGPLITSTRYNEQGATETTVTQEVLAAGSVPTADALLVQASSLQAQDTVIAQKNTVTIDAHPTLSEKRLEASIPGQFLLGQTLTRTVETGVVPATNPTALSDTVLQSSVQQRSLTKAQRETMSRSGTGAITLTGSRATSEHGGGIVTDTSTVTLGRQTPERGLLVLSSVEQALGAGRTQLDTVKLPGTRWPILEDVHTDEASGVQITITKQVVAPASAKRGKRGNTYWVVQAIDDTKVINIGSTLVRSSLPAPFTYYARTNVSYPPVLLNAVMIGNASRIDFIYDFRESFSGTVNARITEHYFTNDQYRAWRPPAEFHFFAEEHEVAILRSDDWQIIRFPRCLHPRIDLTLNGWTLQIPATDPYTLTPGQWHVSQVIPEKQRFGLWFVRVIEAQVPRSNVRRIPGNVLNSGSIAL